MIRSIALIEYDNNNKLHSNLEKLKKYSITSINGYGLFIKSFEKKNFDLCIVNLQNKRERDFILYYISQIKRKQRILFYMKRKKDCFFKTDCILCSEYRIKSLYRSINNENLGMTIDNFTTHSCKFYREK